MKPFGLDTNVESLSQSKIYIRTGKIWAFIYSGKDLALSLNLFYGSFIAVTKMQLLLLQRPGLWEILAGKALSKSAL